MIPGSLFENMLVMLSELNPSFPVATAIETNTCESFSKFLGDKNWSIRRQIFSSRTSSREQAESRRAASNARS